MGNSAFGYRNAVVLGTLKAGAEEPLMGVSRMGSQLGSFASGWQTPNQVIRSKYGSWFQLDNLVETNFRAFLLSRTNLSPAAKVRWRVGQADGIVAPDPAVDCRFAQFADYTAPTSGTLSVTRASSALRCRKDGVWESVGANLPRIHYSPRSGTIRGIMAEAASTNRIRNARFEGLVPPSTDPTYMTTVDSGGLTHEWVGLGTLDGLPGAYLRIYGTATTGASVRVYLDTETAAAMTNGQAQSIGVFVYAVADSGGTAGLTGMVIGLQALDSSSTVLATYTSSPQSVTDTRPGASRRTARFSPSAGATTAYGRPFIEFPVTDGATVDFTLWLGAAQYEANASSISSPILPPAGAPAAQTRSLETVIYTPPAGWFNADEGAFVAEWVLANVENTHVHPGNLTGGIALQTDNGTLNERYLIRASSIFQLGQGTVGTDFVVAAGGTVVYDAPGFYGANPPRLPEEFTEESPFRAAISYKAGSELKAFYMGQQLNTGYSGTLPTGITRFTASGSAAAGNPCILRWRYYPFRLSDAVLLSMTLTGEALDPSAVSYDSGWLSNTLALGVGQSCHIAPQAYSSRYARCDIEDPDNPDGFINVPLCYMGPLWEPTHGADWSSSMTTRSVEQSVEARGGQEYVEPIYRQRVWEFSLAALKDEEVWPYQQELELVAATGENVLFLPDLSSPYLGSEALFGVLRSLSPIGYSAKSLKYRTWRARISERL